VRRRRRSWRRGCIAKDGCGDFFALADAADRGRGGCFGRVELALGDHVGDHRGFDGAGADRVDGIPRGAYSKTTLVVSPITPCLEAW
jgi:hypothetical protein